MSTPYQLFHRAERIERLCAEIYLALARSFGGDPAARELFLRLAGEEEQHANRVRLLAAHYRNDTKLRVDADEGALDACAAECEQALEEIEAGSWGTDLGEVKRRAAALEELLAQAHAELLARNVTTALREFLAQLASQDEAHARLLTD